MKTFDLFLPEKGFELRAFGNKSKSNLFLSRLRIVRIYRNPFSVPNEFSFIRDFSTETKGYLERIAFVSLVANLVYLILDQVRKYPFN